ncbi:hypothetical protein NXV12_31125 [Bacteroides thetaiotaomicron]|nr:hypothetical protein [Bacteroides thetaiotaomicron]
MVHLGRTWDAIKLDPEKGLGFDNGLILRNDAGSKYFRPFERIMNETEQCQTPDIRTLDGG